MSRYIDADKVLEKINKICNRCGKMNENNGAMCGACYFDDAKDMIDDFPTAEVKPIVYAEWVIKKTKQRTNYKTAQTGHCYWLHEQYVCSNCGERPLVERADDCADEVLSNYCPNCGAKMKEREEEE